MSEQTPGPWHYALTAAGTAHVYIAERDTPGREDSDADAEIAYASQMSKAENAANARLIAAGPELLVALTKLLRDTESAWPKGKNTPSCVRARAAIAKAEGRS